VLSPLLTTLSLKLDTHAGVVVGRMYALSALGSILGTFLTGYWLVQWLGTRSIIVVVAVLLFLMALPFLFRSLPGRAATVGGSIAFGLLVLVTWLNQGFANPCDVESNYYCLRVVEERDESNRPVGRTLVLDHMIHSTSIEHEPAQLWTPYIHAMDTLVHHHFDAPDSLSWFFAGGGAYTHPRAVAHRYPDADIAVSEIDPAVTQIALERLFLDTSGMAIHHQDTRIVLDSYTDDRFDVIVTDVFHDVGIPFHLTTREYNALIADKLSADGLYLVNVVDVFPDNRLIQSMYRTLGQFFDHVGVWVERPPKDVARLTFVLSASSRAVGAEQVSSRDGIPRTWFNIADFIAEQAARNEAPLLTDHYAPVERLLSKLLTTGLGN
jgi:spermidine synthase